MKYPDDYVNKIICGDSLFVMKLIPDKAIDLILTDPPYGDGNLLQNLFIIYVTSLITINLWLILEILNKQEQKFLR